MLQDTDLPLDLDSQDIESGNIFSLPTYGEAHSINQAMGMHARNEKIFMSLFNNFKNILGEYKGFSTDTFEHLTDKSISSIQLVVRTSPYRSKQTLGVTSNLRCLSNESTNALPETPRYWILLRAEYITPEPRTAEKLGKIRKVFGLNLSELATIFRVKRRTVSGWLKGAAEPRNSTRLSELYDIAADYHDKGIGSIAHYLKTSIDGSPSLFELFMAESLDMGKITILLNQLLEKQIRKASLRRHTSELAEKHGFQRLTEQEQDENISRASLSIS